MRDLDKIKLRLLNEDRVDELLETIGCDFVTREQGGFLITAQLPEHFYSNNKRSVQVKMDEYMSCSIRSRGDFKGDIFSLVSYILHNKRGTEEINDDLPNAKAHICNTFGWREFLGRQRGLVIEKDYTAPLREILKGYKRRREVKPNPILPEETMNQFYMYNCPLPYKKWIDEGISYKTQVMYGVGYDWDSKRVVFPLRNRFGKLVGVKGRAMDEDVESKYMYLYRCNISREWFNWHIAHEQILIDKKVIIVESEKSCMKFASLGIYNTLAICSSSISDFQADMVKNLGLDVEIYLAYDKDKSAKEVKEYAKIFNGRKVYGIIDTNNLLGEKDSPIDCGLEVWNHLYENNAYEIFS